MEEPSQQGGSVQQFFWEQPARVSHSAQLPLWKPMALSSNSCKLPGFSPFWSFYSCSWKRSFAFPPKHPTHLGDLSGSCLLIPAEYPCSQPFPPLLHCTAMAESFLFALSHQYLPRCKLRTNPPLPLRESSPDHPWKRLSFPAMAQLLLPLLLPSFHGMPSTAPRRL